MDASWGCTGYVPVLSKSLRSLETWVKNKRWVSLEPLNGSSKDNKVNSGKHGTNRKPRDLCHSGWLR